MSTEEPCSRERTSPPPGWCCQAPLPRRGPGSRLLLVGRTPVVPAGCSRGESARGLGACLPGERTALVAVVNVCPDPRREDVAPR